MSGRDGLLMHELARRGGLGCFVLGVVVWAGAVAWGLDSHVSGFYFFADDSMAVRLLGCLLEFD